MFISRLQSVCKVIYLVKISSFKRATKMFLYSFNTNPIERIYDGRDSGRRIMSFRNAFWYLEQFISGFWNNFLIGSVHKSLWNGALFLSW